MYKKKWFLKPICLINLTQAANFSKQDSYPALYHQKMILKRCNSIQLRPKWNQLSLRPACIN